MKNTEQELFQLEEEAIKLRTAIENKNLELKDLKKKTVYAAAFYAVITAVCFNSAWHQTSDLKAAALIGCGMLFLGMFSTCLTDRKDELSLKKGINHIEAKLEQNQKKQADLLLGL